VVDGVSRPLGRRRVDDRPSERRDRAAEDPQAPFVRLGDDLLVGGDDLRGGRVVADVVDALEKDDVADPGQPYIDAMLKTEVPAEIGCDQAMAAAGSLRSAANVFSSDGACRDSTTNADTSRKMLNLPPTIG
jgi:hypothetical protein